MIQNVSNFSIAVKSKPANSSLDFSTFKFPNNQIIKMGNCKENPSADAYTDYIENHEESFNPYFEKEKLNMLIKNDEMKKYIVNNNTSKFELPGSNTVYTGDIHELKANGYGSLQSDTYAYSGDFVNGKPNGNGIIVFTNGTKYNGAFVNGYYHGNGCYRSNADFTYEGSFKLNKFEGQGKCAWQSGSKYQGEFKADKFDGIGEYTFADGRVYRGRFKNGVKHGEGVLTIPGKLAEITTNFEKGELIKILKVTIDGQDIPVHLFPVGQF